MSVAMAWRIFDAFFRPFMRSRLRVVMRTGPPLAGNAPVVFVSNHTSWWDGFLLRQVQRKLAPDAHLYSVMLARELRTHPFLEWIGAVPVEPGSVAAVRSLLRFLTRRAQE